MLIVFTFFDIKDDTLSDNFIAFMICFKSMSFIERIT
jgi:hypothetical protein